MMTGFGKLDWGNWLYGLFAAFIGGGAGAVVTGFAASALAPNELRLGSFKSFELIGMVFLIKGMFVGCAFLAQQPLPQKVTVTTVETTETNPPVTVKTTVEETKVEEK